MGNFYQPQQAQNPLAGILQALFSGAGGAFAPQSAPQQQAVQPPAAGGVPNARDLAGMQAQTALQPGANAYGFTQQAGGQVSALNPFAWLTQAAPGFQGQQNASGSMSFTPQMGNPGATMAGMQAPEQKTAGIAGMLDGGILAPTTQLGGMMGGSDPRKRRPFGVL